MERQFKNFGELKIGDTFRYWLFGFGYLFFIKPGNNIAVCDSYKRGDERKFNYNDNVEVVDNITQSVL